MIQAIFFDIDGTLKAFDQEDMSASTKLALDKARANGVKLFVATGRPKNSMGFISQMYDFDGYLTANGQYCFTRDDKLIHETYIPKESMEVLLPYLDEKKIGITMAQLDCSYANQYNDQETHWPHADLSILLDKPILQVMAYIPPEDDEAFISHFPGCKTARWTDRFADVVPSNGGKDKGIDAMLAYYGIPLDNVMAFGDGGNDISMLKHVPYGVAMGNANDEVKSHAYYITSDVHDDGIYNALVHFGVIEK